MLKSNQKKSQLVFPRTSASDFYSEVKRRVHGYFEQENISPHANWVMWTKIALFLSIYAISYLLLITNVFGTAGMFVLFAIIGFMIAMLGFNLSHDVLHGALSASPRLNYWMGYLFDLNGSSSYIWKVTHNIKHHTFTNIHGHDEDINKMIVFRLSPLDGRYWFHRFQHLYAPFLYGLLSIRWIFYTDYVELYALNKEKKIPLFEIAMFFLFKAINFTLFVILPFTLIAAPWPLILAGLVLMHAVTSVTLSFVFQLAHIVEGVAYPNPDEQGVMENDWAAHEMKTTSNFGTHSQLLTHLVGGLNFQVEHHLFPKVCHVHYPEIKHIVKETAEQYHLPYNEQPTFLKAMASHFATLRKLGRGEKVG